MTVPPTFMSTCAAGGCFECAELDSLILARGARFLESLPTGAVVEFRHWERHPGQISAAAYMSWKIERSP